MFFDQLQPQIERDPLFLTAKDKEHQLVYYNAYLLYLLLLLFFFYIYFYIFVCFYCTNFRLQYLYATLKTLFLERILTSATGDETEMKHT